MQCIVTLGASFLFDVSAQEAEVRASVSFFARPQSCIVSKSAHPDSETSEGGRCLQAALNPPAADKREIQWGERLFRTGDLGVAQGDFSLMGENRLRLDYLPADCQLLGGDLVVTSGLGGYYPSGLSVGTVEEVQLSDSGAASYAVLEPAADFDSLVEVFVIKSFDIQT